ncbi:unnamed protein product, partial [Ectocarpus sp. 8 AP-2014]
GSREDSVCEGQEAQVRGESRARCTGVCVWIHGGAHVGTAVDIFLAGLPVAFVVFACPVWWQGGWQRGGTVHCSDVFVRVGTTVVAIGMMTALLDHAAQQIIVVLFFFPMFFPLKF